MKTLTGDIRKNRWGGLCGPSYWVCRNEACTKVREVVLRPYADTYATCEACYHGLYRSREQR